MDDCEADTAMDMTGNVLHVHGGWELHADHCVLVLVGGSVGGGQTAMSIYSQRDQICVKRNGHTKQIEFIKYFRF